MGALVWWLIGAAIAALFVVEVVVGGRLAQAHARRSRRVEDLLDRIAVGVEAMAHDVPTALSGIEDDTTGIRDDLNKYATERAG